MHGIRQFSTLSVIVLPLALGGCVYHGWHHHDAYRGGYDAPHHQGFERSGDAERYNGNFHGPYYGPGGPGSPYDQSYGQNYERGK